MPLLDGDDKGVIGENVREMKRAGHPEAQAVAAAMRKAGKSKKKPKKGMKHAPTSLKQAGKEE